MKQQCVGILTSEVSFIVSKQERSKVKSCTAALKPGRVIRFTFCPGHPGLRDYTGLARIGSREKRNCLV